MEMKNSWDSSTLIKETVKQRQRKTLQIIKGNVIFYLDAT